MMVDPAAEEAAVLRLAAELLAPPSDAAVAATISTQVTIADAVDQAGRQARQFV